MYCVIQTVTNKKSAQYGGYKEILADSITLRHEGEEQTKYIYTYSTERFERSIREAYKISIHKSYRQDGKVMKKQWSICTMSYYDLIEFSLYDCAADKIERKSNEIGLSLDEIYNLIEVKLAPLRERAEKEFQETEEYKAGKKHDEIIQSYLKAKRNFEAIYGSGTYDYCYDVFGTLQNKDYYDELVRNKDQREEEKRSYYNDSESNYSDHKERFSSYFAQTNSTYTDKEKVMLKKIYREASKKFHPDITNDDGEMMKFLTKLKEEWRI
ncbi:hypothetical protein OK414_29390 [Priestia sp. JV24]|uniref:hypothetical protein n=1 Tax=Priestia TaxID=2800373 RepID=UPI0021D69C56|nr:MULTISPECIES: hypothetical protein [Priestia]MCU7712984.1 hypothetical protein [Priestia megaterium]MCW1049169.1 hypothetical protein [Priestia sp. JV24]